MLLSLRSLCSRGLVSFSPAAGGWSPVWLRPHPSLTADSVSLGKLVHPQPTEPVHLRLQIYCPAPDTFPGLPPPYPPSVQRLLMGFLKALQIPCEAFLFLVIGSVH